ncbi:hypothetical protein FRC01_002750, partial [Tulasnella sp. 417]
GDRYLGGSLLEPGEDSTKNYMHNFVRIMVNHEAEQEKARDEIERLVGRDRMPTADDLPYLPYVRAIVQEVIRLRPFAPLGLPHMATEDVAYKGYRVPSDSTILLNVWSIFHDEALFETPDAFNPRRFLDSPTGTKVDLESKMQPLLNDLVFGADKRADGEEIEVDTTDCKDNATSSPNPFECEIRPRSPKHAQIIREAFIESALGCAPFEHELDDDDRAYLRAAKNEASQNS